MTYPSGDTVNFSPNTSGQPSKAELSSQNTLYAQDILYHANGDINSFKYGNGIEFLQTQNDRGLPEFRQALLSNEQDSPMSLKYTYDARKNTTHIDNLLDNSRNITNTFDGLNRLDTATSQSWGGELNYTYDPIGNLRKRSISGNPFNTEVYFSGINGEKNRVSGTSVNGSVAVYQYDDRGNVTNNNKHAFNYDYLNQPTTINSQGHSGTFIYDGHKKRVKKIVNGKTTYSVYTLGAGLVTQYNKTDQTHTDYIRAGGTLIARVESKGSAADPNTNAFNQVLQPEQTNSALIWTDQSLPYGLPLDSPAAKADSLGYTGHVKDDSGLVYMQARYYDPVIGRFLSNDPVGYSNVHNFNRYAYANNNPYKFVDPDGRSSECFFCRRDYNTEALMTKGKAVRQTVDGIMAEESGANNIQEYNTPTLGEALSELGGKIPGLLGVASAITGTTLQANDASDDQTVSPAVSGIVVGTSVGLVVEDVATDYGKKLANLKVKAASYIAGAVSGIMATAAEKNNIEKRKEDNDG
ncbi:RHS repeat-associated core domain-containing protein [Algibacillus agarilyticus]|uniref:RHS repeat-associated core domain-containing protein n=1 Tax=Algibacillus agarilyticus TaxID=2234133 RepID=UPI000DD07DFF|nr:RHS repeat-associated core domain-containing protein [Algibacillus agarilyticus]